MIPKGEIVVKTNPKIHHGFYFTKQNGIQVAFLKRDVHVEQQSETNIFAGE